METTIPAELLELKSRFDQWRATRGYDREPMPADLRQAAIEISRRYPRALVRRVLKIDPWRLNRADAKKPTRVATRSTKPATFFKLPAGAILPEPALSTRSIADCRLQFERSDGARLTLSLPGLDLVSINRIAADFLRGDKQ